MTHHILTLQSYLQNEIAELKTLIRNLKHTYARNRKINATIKELRALSDSELHDIGISRGEIYDIAHNVNHTNGWGTL